MSRYVDLYGPSWDGKPISSKIEEVKTKNYGYLQGITIGWLWGDNVPHIDLEEHDAEIRRKTILEVVHAMHHECFEVSHEQDGLQKWESGNWLRYKLFEKVADRMLHDTYKEGDEC